MNLDLLAMEAKRLRDDDLRQCLDPSFPKSRPEPHQMEFFRDICRYQYRAIRGGNQCLAKGTKVATPKGPVSIEHIKVGDTVYSEQGKEIKVTAVWNNGIKPVRNLTSRGTKIWAKATDEHVWLGNLYSRKNGQLLREVELETRHLNEDEQVSVKRVFVTSPLGDVNEPLSYALGAFLGDGCSREKRQDFVISSANELIPNKVAALLGSEAKRMHHGNYSWLIKKTREVPHYDEWCRGKYAHEKLADLSVIKTWNRDTLLRFVAGVVDTDGSVHPGKDFVTIAIGMQAKPVIEAMEYAFLALWQVPLSYNLHDGEHYVNGPIHNVYTRNVHEVRRVMQELEPHLVSPQKKWREEYDSTGGRRSRLDAVRLSVGGAGEEIETYDITVDSERSLYLLANGLVTHNSSKSSCITRELSWCMTGTHPFWERHTAARCPVCKTTPSRQEGYDYYCDAGHIWRDWGSGPMTALVVGQSRAAMEKELWENKMLPFFPEDKWKPERSGGYISAATNQETGDRIIFLSHADSSPKNIKYLQTYVANIILLDEMPSNVAVFEEVMRRGDSRRAILNMGFTPKVFNGAVKRFVDEIKAPQGKVYRFSKFQNPLFKGKEAEELAKLEGLPEHTKRCILYGDWMPGDGMVFWYDENKHARAPHPMYNQDWPHVLVVDPATESKLGYLLCYRVPDGTPPVAGAVPPGCWGIREASYVEGIYTPHKIVEEVEKKAAGYNLVDRIADPAASWFIRAAEDPPESSSLKPTRYNTVVSKNLEGRKDGMIAATQQKLGVDIFLERGKNTVLLADELGSMMRSTDTGKIRKARKYHLIDCFNYFVDCLPYRLPSAPIQGLEAQRRAYHEWKEFGGSAPSDLSGLIETTKKFHKIQKTFNALAARRRFSRF